MPAYISIRRVRIVQQICADSLHGRICRSLVQLIAQSRLVKAVHAQEPGILYERTCRVVLNKMGKVGLGSVEVPLVVVAQGCVVLHGVVLGGSADSHGDGLEELGSLGVPAAVEVFEGGIVFGLGVGTLKKFFVLGFAGCNAEQRHCCRQN